MKPVKVTYLCEECGALFERAVAEVLIDDEAHCDVIVELINGEEFPMCDCLHVEVEAE